MLTAAQLTILGDDIVDLDRRTSPVVSTASGTQTGVNSTTYTTLPTTTPAVTVTIGANRKAQVGIYGAIDNANGQYTLLSFAVTGAANIAASDRYSLQNLATTSIRGAATFILDSTYGLNAGSTTFALRVRVSATSTGTVSDPQIWATPLSS